LAKAVLELAKRMAIPPAQPSAFRYTPGGGIACVASNGDELRVGSRAFLERSGVEVARLAPPSEHLTEVLVSRAGRLLGALHFADVLRPEAARAVLALKSMGLRTVLLTGDALAIAGAVGKQLGVNEVVGGLLPEQKLQHVNALRTQGRHVAMVGDGINDAPALMAANVGIAMGGGTDVAQESAGVLLLGDDLDVLVDLLAIARRCHGIIMQNFWGTLLVDTAGMGLAAFGFLNPLLAAFIHVSSELVFILNSTRLLARKRSNARPLPAAQPMRA
jgi:Cd2+/Zn2+-exporting ATPase/Cu+-exporting ATPase